MNCDESVRSCGGGQLHKDLPATHLLTLADVERPDDTAIAMLDGLPLS
jgi:hypothetical protein